MMLLPDYPLINQLAEVLHTLPVHYEAYAPLLEQAEALAQTAQFSAADQAQIRTALLPHMTDPAFEPDPYQRMVIGRVIGILDLDHRKGIGLNPDGLPEIDWVEIPVGEFIFQDDQHLSLPTYYISRYHITYKQFQAFIAAEDGFRDPRWWDGLAEKKERFQIQNTPPTQVFRFWNHPFDGACWYDAIAFCRWWSFRLGGSYDIDRVMDWKVRLATVQEWEKAARGTDGRRYPWGDSFISGYANFDETDRFNIQAEQMKIRSGKIGPHFYSAPSAVGVFPKGASPYGVMDMCGTMWDITLTEYRHHKNEDLRDYYPRIMKGGTWFTTEMYSDMIRETMHYPNGRTNGDPRKNDYGFRVCAPQPV